MNAGKLIGQFLGILLLVSLVGYVVMSNFSPFGMTVAYSLQQGKNALVLGPKDRVKTELQNGEITVYQIHDLIYFLTPMPFHFDSATVTMSFQNPNPDQTIAVGFQDKESWHYNTQLFDVPFLNTLSWNKVGTNPTLYQKDQHFTSVGEFLSSPPKDALIATYFYDSDFGKNVSDTKLSDYSPSKQDTILTTPLRGKHILYVYVDNEPFSMTIQKQDLNWYEDPDVMTISVYKDNTLVYSSQIDDDGIADNSQKVLPPQEVTIKNPGPGLPESGIYKIVIDANSDTVIKQITTNLHKIVFQGYLFPVNNKDAYGALVASTSATTLFTNALALSATTYHNAGVQDITIGNEVLHVASVGAGVQFIPKEDITKITIPKNDVVLKGFQGFFAFSEDQFFLPIPYHVLPITQKEDVQLADYILANYTPSQQMGDMRVGEYTFNLSSAFIKNGQLSWVIKSPGLQDAKGKIVIKDIRVVLYKKPWL